ncbi:hypothetical protein GCM10027404_22800 [Arthrobacter tumbae]|uniref:hypothetical protein n=1 Tax=Arthrobacter tumbae TaxID=163874 RepID=UPI00195E3702|nr:hypothetical protein [Arthrobacter tumbae]MBM7781305.1 hypothetical protein [Arthrobacter tumbae]
MYRSMAAGSTCEQEPSEAARDFARRLGLQADVVDAVRQRIGVAQSIHWESPAGRNFRSYLIERESGLRTASALLREAAVSMEGYGIALQMGETTSGSQG